MVKIGERKLGFVSLRKTQYSACECSYQRCAVQEQKKVITHEVYGQDSQEVIHATHHSLSLEHIHSFCIHPMFAQAQPRIIDVI